MQWQMMVRSLVSRLYENDSSALIGSGGGRRLRREKSKVNSRSSPPSSDFSMPGESAEIQARGGAFDSQQFLEILRVQRLFRPAPELDHQRLRWFDMIAPQHRALIADLGRRDLARDGEAKDRLLRQRELLAPQKHIFEPQPMGQAVKPAAIGEMRPPASRSGTNLQSRWR